MLKSCRLAAMALALSLVGTNGYAQNWNLVPDASHLAFGSIKKDKIGEVHSFKTLSGSVREDGTVMLSIDLNSVETNIDIRNERMIEHVFKAAGQAELKASVDMAALNTLAVGDTQVIDVVGALSLLGTSVELDAEMFVARLSQDKVMVSTNDMIFLGSEEAGIDAGVSKLMELAKLPGITRTSPVTMRLIFAASGTASATPTTTAAAATTEATTEVAMAGDAKAGKKVFRKGKACHKLEEGKNAVGPSLYGVMGRTSGSLEGFKFSKAMMEAGVVWDAQTLGEFLKKPKAYIKGTKMAFPGLRKPKQIDDLVAYLADASSK